MREFSIGNIPQSSFPTFFDVNVGYLQKAKALVIEFSTIVPGLLNLEEMAGFG